METDIARRKREIIMSWINEDTYGGFWDLGDFLTTDLVTLPIRRMINRDAERHGINLRNPCRSVASLLGSCGLGGALGVVLGFPGGILGALSCLILLDGQHQPDPPIDPSGRVTPRVISSWRYRLP